MLFIDISPAYHHIEVASRFRDLQDFLLGGGYYKPKCLPLGLSISVYEVCVFATVKASANRYSGLTTVLTRYADDFLGYVKPHPNSGRLHTVVTLFRDFRWVSELESDA